MPHDLQLTSEPAQEEVVMLRRKLRKNILQLLSKLDSNRESGATVNERCCKGLRCLVLLLVKVGGRLCSMSQQETKGAVKGQLEASIFQPLLCY